MEDFDITIEHRGASRTFQGRLGTYGWTYRIVVDIEGNEIIFEPDEEKNLRAILEPQKNVDERLRELVTLVGNELEKELNL
jgi:hypothetical protein